MATHANSTTAPARPLLPLRGPDGRFARRAESTAPAPCDASALASESAPEGTGLLAGEPPVLVEVGADLDALVGGAKLPTVGNLLAEPDTAARARANHARRALAAAVDHGVALFTALGLPQLLGPDRIAIDPEAAGAALDDAIAALDEADGDADAEPWLGWAGADRGVAVMGGASDREAETEHDEDDGTGEPSLASPERHPSPPDYYTHRYTARSTADRQTHWAEGAQHDGELVNEDGDPLDDGEHDTADAEPWLGSLEHVDQSAWAESDGTGRELAGDDCLSSRLSIEDSRANGEAARKAGQEARALAARVRGAKPTRDPDTLSFAGMRPGTGLWRPHFHNGVLVMGYVS